MSHVHAFSCIRTFNSLYSFILFCWSFSNCLSLSFSFFLALVYSMEPKCKSTLSQNPLRSGASTSSFNPTPSHERFRDDKAWKDFSENFLDEAFIWIAKSSYRIFSILTFLLSSIVGVGGHCVTFRSLVPSWSYRSFTSICTNSILCTSFLLLCSRYTHLVTSDIVSVVLHVPRVTHPDYPSCDRLRTMSKDELSSLFAGTPLSWGDRQNTPCSGFAKGLRLLNMVITFILHPLSHYNFIFVLDFFIPLRGHFYWLPLSFYSIPYKCL